VFQRPWGATKKHWVFEKRGWEECAAAATESSSIVHMHEAWSCDRFALYRQEQTNRDDSGSIEGDVAAGNTDAVGRGITIAGIDTSGPG
jgi:hypothetical protein